VTDETNTFLSAVMAGLVPAIHVFLVFERGKTWMPGFMPGMTKERPGYSSMQWFNIVLQGVLIGGLYAMFAAGLSLIFGVMRLVNIAHGDLIVLAAYVSLVVTQAMGVDPLTSLLLVVPIMAVIGYALQRGLLNRTLGDDLLPPLLVTFGLSIIIQNGLLELFTADSRRLQAGAIEVQTFELLQGVWIGVLPLLQFAIAVAVIAGLQILFYRTALGRAFRATSDDPSVAQLMGLDTRHVFAMAMALSLAVIAIAGVFLAVRTNFDPAIGPARLIFGFEAVIIGGLGSMWGTLAGGIILGVSQAIGAQIDPGWQLLAGHIVFLAILAVRPHGFFPKVSG
jgi:branched-chain amino acid transport system permease protein